MAVETTIPVAEASLAGDGMSSRERLTEALSLREPDRVPVAFKTVDPLDDRNPRLSADPNYRRLCDLASRYCEVFHDWKIDERQPYFSGSPQISSKTTRSRDGRETLTEVTTPAGSLTRIQRYIEGSSWDVKPFLATEQDFEMFLAHEWEPLRPDLAGFWREAERLGDRGLMRIPLRDPLGGIELHLDRETMYVWMVERPDFVDLLLERVFRATLDLVTYLAEAGVRCVFQFGGAEQATPPMASPAMFERFVTRYGPPITKVLRDHGCTPYLHCHGLVGGLLETFVEMGYVATHPVEPPPMGNVTPAQFRDRVGDRLAMIGNIQIGEVLAGEPATIRDQVRELIATVGPGGGLVVCESASPWETPMKDRTLANYVALIEAVHTHGRYPLAT